MDILYNKSPAAWVEYLTQFMLRGLYLFNTCKKDLSDRNEITKEFNVVLDMQEQGIIADCAVIEWLTKEILDTNQLTGMIQQGREANRYSEANLLKAKQDALNAAIERLSTQQTEYALKNTNWSTWGG